MTTVKIERVDPELVVERSSEIPEHDVRDHDRSQQKR